MIGNDYVLAKPPPPSPLKRFVDLQLFPRAIDAVAAVEIAIEHISVRGRERPTSTAIIAFALGCLVGGLYAARPLQHRLQ